MFSDYFGVFSVFVGIPYFPIFPIVRAWALWPLVLSRQDLNYSGSKLVPIGLCVEIDFPALPGFCQIWPIWDPKKSDFGKCSSRQTDTTVRQDLAWEAQIWPENLKNIGFGAFPRHSTYELWPFGPLLYMAI